jgi:predicted metalloprotease
MMAHSDTNSAVQLTAFTWQQQQQQLQPRQKSVSMAAEVQADCYLATLCNTCCIGEWSATLDAFLLSSAADLDNTHVTTSYTHAPALSTANRS